MAYDKRQIRQALSRIPDSGRFSILQIARFVFDYEFLLRQHRQRGDIFRFRIPREPTRVIAGNPEHIRDVFALRPESYYSGDPGLHVNYGERCILFNDGERHKKDRQLLMPPLHGEMLRGYGNYIAEQSELAFSTWQPGDVVVATEAFKEITIRVITRCILGAQDNQRESLLRQLVDGWLGAIISPPMFIFAAIFGLNRTRRFLEARTDTALLRRRKSWLPFPGRQTTDLKWRYMQELLVDIASCRQGQDPDRMDVLAQTARATYEDGTLMDAHTIVDQLTLLFSAGHETTAKSLAFVVRDLLAHPDAYSAVQAEVRGAFGSGDIDPQVCQELPLLNSVIKESMRLTPVAPVVQRDIIQPMKLGEYDLVPGMTVAPCSLIAQRHPDYWEDPDRFVPDRFAELSKNPPPWQYFPFGGGRRKCLGVAFAMYEMPVILASLLKYVEISEVPGGKSQPIFAGVTFGPRDGLKLGVKRVH